MQTKNYFYVYAYLLKINLNIVTYFHRLSTLRPVKMFIQSKVLFLFVTYIFSTTKYYLTIYFIINLSEIYP